MIAKKVQVAIRGRAKRKVALKLIDDNPIHKQDDQNQSCEQVDADDFNDNGNNKEDSIWEEWKQFIDDQENNKCLMELR